MSARIEALAAILHNMPGNGNDVQCARMLAAMEQLGSVTTFEGSRYLDCYDPRARVHALRRGGTSIKTIMRGEQTESGVLHRVGVYLLDGGANA